MLLLWLVLIPFLVGLLSWFSECICYTLPRWIALFGIVTVFIMLLILWYGQDQECTLNNIYMLPQWQKQYILPWILYFGINVHLVLDGLSVLMVLLSSLLGFLAVICSWKDVKRKSGLFYFNFLWLFSCVIGVFLSIDMFLFFVFWEMMIFPIYLLIVLWGHKTSSSEIRIQAAKKFFVYSQVSSLAMLVAIFGLVVVHYNLSGVWTFNYEDLLFTPMSSCIEYVLMLGFFIAFAVKLPIVPFHGWLSDVHSQTPTSGSLDILGFSLKTSAYGLLRFALPLFPNASMDFAFVGVCLGVISIFYCSLMAFAQYDVKRLIAYSSMSHMGFVLLGIYSGSLLAYQGSVIYTIAHSLSASAMFVLCGQLFNRLKTRDMRLMGGLWDKLTLIPGLSLFFSVSMLGLPGTGNFVGEAIILFGAFQAYPKFTVVAAFGLIFSSIYSLIVIHRIYYGKSNINYDQYLLYPMIFREKFIMFLLLLLIVYLGCFPQFIIDMIEVSVNNIHRLFVKDIDSFIITG